MGKQEGVTYTREFCQSGVHLLVTGRDGLTDVCIVPGEKTDRSTELCAEKNCREVEGHLAPPIVRNPFLVAVYSSCYARHLQLILTADCRDESM